MVYEIIIGRGEKDKEKHGKEGTILLGKHYIKMGQVTSLSNPILMDVTRSHVVFVAGKRGGGKSYTMGVIAEGMANLPPNIAENLSIIMLDTMGIYWTMKYPNHKDEELLKEWKLEGKGLDVKIYTPAGYYDEYKKKGIPTDFPFSLKPSELSPEDWWRTFSIASTDALGVFIERIILTLKKDKGEFGIDDIIKAVKDDKKVDNTTKDAAENRFLATKEWGLFSKNGTPLHELAKGGQVTVLDVSCYATAPGGWEIKSLVVGITAQKLFIDRMVARKDEEYASLHSSMHYLEEEKKPEKKMPLVWLVIDEAHEFMPVQGKTTATDALVTILREGRQPGISLILATQQPGKIHTDVMTQSDIIISHRITAKLDTDALGMLMQSYMRQGLDKELNNLPRVKGAAIILDDSNERMYPMRVRPRFTWHGGEAPTAIPEKRKVFEF
jgi:hypothetical protein